MFTAEELLWRLKYFLVLVMIFAATSFLPSRERSEQSKTEVSAATPDTTTRP